MDISVYISELLYEHDCVIIPGFGGFVCNYKPAEIHPILHTVAPPAKAISFNRNLNSNDGLLVNYIANKAQISFDAALDSVSQWANSSKAFLRNREEVVLRKIGKLHTDVEGNYQFIPDERTNYLRSSFGLRTITAQPVLRGKEISFTEKFTTETKHPAVRRRAWKIAAMVVLFICLGALAQLMWLGVHVEPWKLNEAGVFNFINRIFRVEEPNIKPLPIESENIYADTATALNPEIDSALLSENIVDTFQTIPLPEKENGKAEEHNTEPVKQETTFDNTAPTYYIIIGAFIEEKNIEAAKQRLEQKFPDSVILVEKGKRLTKVGYSAGHNLTLAKEKLFESWGEDSTYWILKK